MIIDLVGMLRRVMNQNAAETFDPATDSLEAIANALGIGPSVGLWMFGIVNTTQVASLVTVITNNLQNIPNDVLEGQFWMQVIYNTSAPATAPEGEFRRISNFVQGGALQTFTVDAFTANVEAGDYVCIFHESLLTQEILVRGTLDTSSATVPADSTRTEGNDYFNGALLMSTEGAVRFQPRRIVDYTGAGGIFTLDPSNPFTAAPGLVDYVIINSQTEFVPAVDVAINRTPADVIGNKTDTIPAMNLAPSATDSLIRHIKAILERVGEAPADPDDSLMTIVGQRDTAAAAGVISDTATIIALLKQAITQQGLVYFGDVTTFTDLNNFASTNLSGRENDYFVGWYVMCVRDDGGASAAPQGEYRLITDYVSATGAFVHNAFTAILAVGDQVLIIHPRVFRAILTTTGTFSHPNGVVEQTVFTITLTKPTEVKSLFLDLVNLTQNATIRIKHEIDGATYRTIETFSWTTVMDDGVYFRSITCNDNIQVTIQSAIAEGAARDIPFEYSLEE